MENASIVCVYQVMEVLLLSKVYEDDFEDDEDKSGEVGDAEENLREVQFSRTSEIEEIQRAITAENDRIFNPLPKKLKNEKKEPVVGMWLDTSFFILNVWIAHTTYKSAGHFF